jgi:CHAT domain-containing protein
VLLDFAAGREAITSGRLRDYRILHLSTHGVADAADPKRSALVFSLVAPDGTPRPGTLSASEIAGLDMRADLVVLSACQTALGRQVAGEGLLSLTRAFLHAGAASVIASLWRVDDEATAALLTHFYRTLFRTPSLAPAAALRQAQLAIGRDSRWRSPFYWASFTLQGEP